MTTQPTLIEQDIFRELISISISKAGDAFSRISQGPIMLKAPEISFVKKPEVIKDLIERNSLRLLVQSGIKGDLDGNTLLFFSDDQIDQLSGKNLNGNSTFILRESLFMEISNILTGSIVSQLANFLKINIYGSVPKQPFDLKKNPPGHDFYNEISRSHSLLVTVETSFVNKVNKLNLPFVLIFDVASMDRIIGIIREKNKTDKILLKNQDDISG